MLKIGDYNTLKKLSKEQSDLEEIVVKYERYKVVENGIEVEVVLEEAVDVIGETKIAVTAFTNIDPDTLDDSFENEINEDFINENAFR